MALADDPRARLHRALTLIVAVSEQVLLELERVEDPAKSELATTVAATRDAAVEALSEPVAPSETPARA